ncbi:hypothetical protein H6P81_004780 [Aristolochia fimbriata]|uniref:Uncharacterized protein n=1 Tax=Aristolochia fimbriata TaxID=158543 RepID=A0AAV7EW63_ARIFI|nr:hypothetical protein H6P81_004780 [Aristolochia fimbriata]
MIHCLSHQPNGKSQQTPESNSSVALFTVSAVSDDIANSKRSRNHLSSEQSDQERASGSTSKFNQLCYFRQNHCIPCRIHMAWFHQQPSNSKLLKKLLQLIEFSLSHEGPERDKKLLLSGVISSAAAVTANSHPSWLLQLDHLLPYKRPDAARILVAIHSWFKLARKTYVCGEELMICKKTEKIRSLIF